MRTSAILLASIVSSLCLAPACANETSLEPDAVVAPKLESFDSPKRKSPFDEPLGGVVVNRTVTVLGQDFYQNFTAIWRQKDINNKFSISIHERPSARFGSEIWVMFRQKRMFHTFLPPARAATKGISAQAVELVYQNIADSEVERIMVKSPDLGPEEM